MTPYPTALPYEDITTIITDIRAGALAADTPRAVKAIWELAGFAAYQALGEPTNIVPNTRPHLLQESPALDTDQVLEYLDLFAAHTKQGVCEAVDVPWQSILKWAFVAIAGAL